ncbi:hypothetical protein NEMIN01_0225 [Nematocida minor]|uniref:uncharacterized protein n=1 Tax=Nematocida minor TaxID=1912983 RepID=UPI00221FDE1A|nr:uncharacterized protein NEMIN01_0225 [Nematocida minor]KAI5188961.1 hypothetical protein NEMIN01_0225 [Nematocida minor]
MILQQVLKKVAIGIAILACLQRAKAELDRDIRRAKIYWKNRMDHINREFQVRCNFYVSANSFIYDQEISSKTLKDNLEDGKNKIFNVKRKVAILDECVETILSIAPKCLKNTSDSNIELNELYCSLRKSLLEAFDKNDSVSDAMKELDSHMLEVVKEYSYIKNKNNRIQESTLFKLAEKNKAFALNMLFSLSRIELFKPANLIEEEIKHAFENKKDYLITTDFSSYKKAIINDIEKGQVNLFGLANKHFYILFRQYGIDANVMNIYLNLLKEDMSKEEIDQYIDITPGQVIKMIILECTLNTYLIDHRRNILFSNLGKVIVNTGRPRINSTGGYEAVERAKERQDKILDALHLLWNSDDLFIIGEGCENFRRFCIDNGMTATKISNIQNIFTFSRWIYTLDILTSTPDNITNAHRVFKKTHFDLSYTHPMCYIYLRSKDAIKQFSNINHLVSIGMNLNDKPFMEMHPAGLIKLRPYKISTADNESLHTENIKDCIRAWYFKRVEIIYILYSDEYLDIANDFKNHFSKSGYVDEKRTMPTLASEFGMDASSSLQDAQMESEEVHEPRGNESNPLQVDQMEIEYDDGFELV